MFTKNEHRRANKYGLMQNTRTRKNEGQIAKGRTGQKEKNYSK